MAEIQEIAIGGSVANGVLQIASGVALDTTLRAVTDQAGNASPLFLSTTQVNIGGGTSLGRLVVRGDGTDPIARFESSTGVAALRISNDGRFVNFGSTAFAAISAADTSGGASIGGFGLRFFTNYSNQTNAIGFNFCTVNGLISPTSGTSVTVGITESFGAAAGSANFRPLNIAYTINNSGAQTGTATGIFLNATETALNGMTHNLMELQVGGNSRFSVSNSGVGIFNSSVITNGNFISNGGDITSSSTGFLKIGTRSKIASSTDGVFTFLNNAGTDFNRLQFGGTSNLFPSIKRNGAGIDFKLADDSGFCGVNTGVLSIQNTVASAVGIASTHKVTIVIGGVTYFLLASNV